MEQGAVSPTPGVSLLLVVLSCGVATATGPVRSPFDVVLSPDASAESPGMAFVTDRTAGVVVGIDIDRGTLEFEVALRGEPTGLAVSRDGSVLYVSEYDAGTVAEIDIEKRAVRRRFDVGLRPMGVALTTRPARLVVANTVTHDVSIVDVGSGRQLARSPVPREPYFVAVTPDGTLALAGNLLPVGAASAPDHGSRVSVLGLSPDRPGSDVGQVIADIRLPPGSTSVRQVKVSRDGRWAYVVHTVGHFHVPATQLERGWINTNALSILDIVGRELYATVLLDFFDRGASDPWGVALSTDSRTLWVTLRGTHQLVALDIDRLHALLAGEERVEDGGWRQIHEDPSLRRELVNDLTALSRAGVSRRIDLPGRGPRGIAVSEDGAVLVVANYYSGDIVVLDGSSGSVVKSIPVGPRSPPDLVRRGEALFHDATISFQSWLSCSTCHPDRARNDALRWDLINDGLGTPQMTRSLLMSYRVAPTTARGVRPDFRASVTAGFKFLNTNLDPERIRAVMAYLSSLKPERSPHRGNGERLNAAQQRGRAVFHGKGVCVDCHSGAIRTDLQAHEVGTAGDDEPGGTAFYTPKLIELYRTAPFLHDGRAPDLMSIFTEHNSEGAHGGASTLTPQELHDLVEFLLTL